MPFYSYQCTNKHCEYHKKELELEKGINDDSNEECPECGSKINRIYKRVGFNLNFNGSFNSTRGGK